MYTTQGLNLLEIVSWVPRTFSKKQAHLCVLKKAGEEQKVLVLGATHALSEKATLFLEDLWRVVEALGYSIVCIDGDLKTGLKQLGAEDPVVVPSLADLMRCPHEKKALWKRLSTL